MPGSRVLPSIRRRTRSHVACRRTQPCPCRHAGPARHRRDASGQRAAGLCDRGVARSGSEGSEGPGTRSADECRVRISDASHHRKPRAGRSPEGVRPFRSANCHRHTGCVRAGPEKAAYRRRIRWRTGAHRRIACGTWCACHGTGRSAGRTCFRGSVRKFTRSRLRRCR